MRFRVGSFLAVCLIILGTGHILQGAKPAPVAPGLAINNKINIVTSDSTDYLRVWEKAASGDTFKAVWKSARVHQYACLDLGNATNGPTGTKAIIATETIQVGVEHKVRFVAYLDGSTGTPQFVSEYVTGGDNSYRFVSKAQVADVTPALAGNEVVVLSDNTLALFHFENTGFVKKAEAAFVGESAKFYDFCTANADADAQDEIIVSAHNEGQVWIYDVVGDAGSVSLLLMNVLELGGDASGSLMGDRVRAADIDGDGDLDIMAYSTRWVDGAYSRYFNTWERIGMDYLVHSQSIPGPGSLFRFDAADLTQDGGAEVVIGGVYEVAVYVWTWSGSSWSTIMTHSLDRNKGAGIAIRNLGGATPRIVMAGSLPNVMTKAYYLETFGYSAGNLSSLWKFEGTYYSIGSLGLD